MEKMVHPAVQRFLNSRPNDAHQIVKFYMDNFGLDLFNASDSLQLRLYGAFINGANPHVRKWFDETFQPFMEGNNARYFNSGVIEMLLAYTYFKGY